MRPFCAMCGIPEDPADKLRDNLCPQCYLRVHPPVKGGTTINVTVCRRCLSYKHGAKWIGSLDNPIVEAVTMRFLQMIPSSYEFSLHTIKETTQRQARIPLAVDFQETTSAGRLVQVSVPITAEVAVGSCDRCLATAAADEHFNIQIRGHSGRLTAELRRHLYTAVLSRFTRKPRVEIVDGGMDIRVQKADEVSKLVDAISTQFRCKVVSTYEEKKDRHVTSIRILDFNLGEIVQYRNAKVRIVGFDRHSAKIEELRSGKKKILPLETLTSEMTHT